MWKVVPDCAILFADPKFVQDSELELYWDIGDGASWRLRQFEVAYLHRKAEELEGTEDQMDL